MCQTTLDLLKDLRRTQRFSKYRNIFFPTGFATGKYDKKNREQIDCNILRTIYFKNT